MTAAAEDISYQLLKKPYFRKNAAYDSLEELHLVRGIGDDFWATFVDPEPEKPKKRVMTVWGQGAVNVNTANEQTLLLLACSYAVPQTKLCNDLDRDDEVSRRAFGWRRSFSPGFRSSAPGHEFIKAMTGKGSGMAATMLKMMQSSRWSSPRPPRRQRRPPQRAQVFSIYADGIVPGYQRKTRVRIHTVVDFGVLPRRALRRCPGAAPGAGRRCGRCHR